MLSSLDETDLTYTPVPSICTMLNESFFLLKFDSPISSNSSTGVVSLYLGINVFTGNGGGYK